VTNVLYISYEFPTLTETFVYREVEQLVRMGCCVRVVSLRRPDDAIALRDVVERLADTTDYVGYVAPVTGLGHLAALFIARPAAVLRAISLLLSPVSPVRKWPAFAYHLLQASYLVRTYRVEEFDLLHAHFAAGPASMALFMSTLSGVPFSITSHAYDLFADQIALRSKLRRAALFLTISEFNRSWLRRRFGDDARAVEVVRCGVDVAQLAVERGRLARVADRVVAVGSLNRKKGHDILVRACGIMKKAGYQIDCRIIGAGSERDLLESLIRELGLGSCVSLMGAMSQDDTHREIAQAAVSVLACRQSPTGDMDGIPVALIESLALGTPVVSTTLSGIGELISNENSGLLVPPESPTDLAHALARILSDDGLRSRVVEAGIRTVEESFDVRSNSARLLTLMEAALAACGSVSA
jgi:colanic acid/amylovoran biosynthesis glycosyltransferase